MRKATTILGWALCTIFVIGGISSPGLQTVFLFAAAVLVSPPFRSKVQIPGKFWIPATIFLFLAGVLLTPVELPMQSPIDSSPSIPAEDDLLPAASLPESDNEFEPESAVNPNSVQDEQVSNPEPPINPDLEIIIRDGHPTYYGSVEASHSIWDDAEKGKIIFPDGYSTWGDKSILSIGAYRGTDLIREIYVSFANFEEQASFSIEEILPIVASYMPFDLMDQYYGYKSSGRIAPNNDIEDKDQYFVISYRLTEDAKTKDIDYSGTIDVVIEVDENGVVQNFNIRFGTPRWMSSLDVNRRHYEEWSCDLYDYRTMQ